MNSSSNFDNNKDKIHLISTKDEKVPSFLKKLGYDVSEFTQESDLLSGVEQSGPDLLIIDSRGFPEVIDLCKLLRSQAYCRTQPIIVLADKNLERELKLAPLPAVESVDCEMSIGPLSIKIATALRLRKMKGLTGASVGDTNLILREVNANLRRDNDQAKDIQRALLPKQIPNVAGWDLGLIYQPFNEVGGDWYFIHQKGGEYVFDLCDVTGHGLSAGLLGSMTKLALFAAAEEETLPKRTAKINNLLSPVLPEAKFITMCSVLISENKNETKLIRAGHPPFLVRRGGKVEEYRPDGYTLGFLPDVEFDEATVELSPGDLILIYSDGIIEAKSRFKEMYGTERVKKSLLESVGKSAQETLENLKADLLSFLDGRDIDDDLTLMAFQRV